MQAHRRGEAIFLYVGILMRSLVTLSIANGLLACNYVFFGIRNYRNVFVCYKSCAIDIVSRKRISIRTYQNMFSFLRYVYTRYIFAWWSAHRAYKLTYCCFHNDLYLLNALIAFNILNFLQIEKLSAPVNKKIILRLSSLSLWTIQRICLN